MRVKKFEAKNMKEALQMVKNHLGPDAVILSAKDNRRNFGIAGEASVEITAAVSESTLQKKQFTESRMTAESKQRFQNSDAKTQRTIIDRMVDNRNKEAAAEVRRPITVRSYIDIPDDEQEVAPPSRHRTAALERAAGRNVRELLNDFDQDFDQEIDADKWQQRPARAVAETVRRPAQAAPQKRTVAPVQERQPQQQGRQQQQQQQRQQAAPVSENAMTRIRGLAREAFAPQGGMETVAPAPARISQNQTQNQALSQTAQQTQMVQAAAMPSVHAQPNPEIASLKSEIGRLQQILETFQKVPQTFVSRHPGAEHNIPYELSFMYQKLTESGITIDHTLEILQKCARENDPAQLKKKPIVDAWVARWFLENTKTVANPFQGRLHLFVGGAGSGKTSALVKMASHLVVKEKRKVAILTTDSFKVGAVDQLKIYCQILNVPFAVIRNRHDWEWVLNQLKGVDHVLVDFPGLQLRDLDEIHMLKSLLPPVETAPVTHLCVAATTKDGDAYETSRRYRVTDYNDLIITNLDQSVQHGIITNLQAKTGKPLHSFGTGSRLPEDFELASKERVLDLIFKLTKLRRDT